VCIIAALVERLQVDGIPHVAFVDQSANLLTTLLGAIPQAALMENVAALSEVPRPIQYYTLLYYACLQ
jgi:hypothetical protein